MKPQALRNAKPANFPTLMFTGIGGSLFVLASYKLWIKPYMDKQRRLDAEMYANVVFDNQLRSAEADHNQ